MAGGRKGQSDITLGGSHLAGIFLGVVVLCGIFFALGYVMGRNGSPGLLPAVTGSKSSPVNADGELNSGKGAPASTGWDFYPRTSASGKRLDATPGLTPAKPVTAMPKPAPRAPRGPIAMQPRPKHLRIVRRPPTLAGGRPGISLQIAAMRDRTDALALAGFLKKKGYPAFAWGPGHDRLFRVQVGPYRDAKSAEAARRHLQHEGFRSILKK